MKLVMVEMLCDLYPYRLAVIDGIKANRYSVVVIKIIVFLYLLSRNDLTMSVHVSAKNDANSSSLFSF